MFLWNPVDNCEQRSAKHAEDKTQAHHNCDDHSCSHADVGHLAIFAQVVQETLRLEFSNREDSEGRRIEFARKTHGKLAKHTDGVSLHFAAKTIKKADSARPRLCAWPKCRALPAPHLSQNATGKVKLVLHGLNVWNTLILHCKIWSEVYRSEWCLMFHWSTLCYISVQIH